MRAANKVGVASGLEANAVAADEPLKAMPEIRFLRLMMVKIFNKFEALAFS